MPEDSDTETCVAEVDVTGAGAGGGASAINSFDDISATKTSDMRAAKNILFKSNPQVVEQQLGA